MKNGFYIICFLGLFPIDLRSQITLQIAAMPQLTPIFDDLYVAGNFNDWNPGDPSYQLTENNGTFSIAISAQAGDLLEFKFTRGSWATVEGGATGEYIPNRNTAYTNGQTLSYEINGWEDLPGAHTVTPEVRILDSDMFLPQLERNRRVWICLPEDYDLSTDDYPVIYMHDAQNIFDQATSFAGEWEADESMQEALLGNCIRAILVGIDNGGSSRIDEYAPWINSEYQEGGEGAEFAGFIVQTLKPFIDSHFRTIPDRDHTAMIGSSLGALITMYTVIEYNDIFSGAALLSPAFWFNDGVYDFVESNPPAAATKFYFVCGANESAGLIGQTQQMHDIIEAAGISDANNVFQVQSGGTHNEYWWSTYFPESVLSLLGCNNSAVEPEKQDDFFVYPNPAIDRIFISFNSGEFIDLEITDTIGKKFPVTTSPWSSSVDISGLTPGIYNLRVTRRSLDGNIQGSTQTFIKK